MSIVPIYLLVLVVAVQGAPKYKLCVYPDKYSKCDGLSRGNSEVQCVQVQDSVQCAQKIQTGSVDFGLFYPEQIHLVSQYVNEESGIVGEVRIQEEETRNNSFQTVVVVRNGEVSSLQDLRKKKYCHPGFDYDELWTIRVREELENRILESVSCSAADNRTMAEKEIAQISHYFGASCRPGPWVADEDFDIKLKKEYSNLCELCDNKEECSYRDNRANENALRCLTEKGGSVAYTSLQAALNLVNRTNYRLLCRNGQVQEITSNITNECSWRNQPWPFIIGQRNKVSALQNDLRSWIDPIYFAVTRGASPYGLKHDWMNTMTDVLKTGESSRFNIFSETITMNEYMQRNEQNLKISASKECNMRWCVTSEDEKNKCEWVNTAMTNAGIQPSLGCVLADNVFQCLNKIQRKEVDVISIDSNYGYLARKKQIHNLLYNEKTPDDVSSIFIVLPPSSDIKSFNDLKNKKACFPEYRGMAWLSFVESARRHKLIRDNCDYGKSITKLFSEICAPGAEDAYHYNSTKTDPKQLCSICRAQSASGAASCAAAETNKYFDNKGALSCLIDNTADVAVIEKHAIDTKAIDVTQFKILCEDGNIVSFEQADEQCALSTTVDSEIISRLNDARNPDFRLALLQMDAVFVRKVNNVRTIALFNKFNDKENLMFKDTVIGFDDGESDNVYVNNYIKLFEHVDECTDGGAAAHHASSFFMIISLVLTIHFLRVD